MFSFFIASLSAIMCYAQELTVPEPEFADEAAVVIDNKATMRPRENAIQKTKASAAILLTGIGKIKTRI